MITGGVALLSAGCVFLPDTMIFRPMGGVGFVAGRTGFFFSAVCATSNSLGRGGISTCHGAVDRMPLMYAAHTLQMEWCIDCHRSPEKNLRPKDQIFNMEYQPPSDQMALGRRLAQQYHLRSVYDLTSCSTCHR